MAGAIPPWSQDAGLPCPINGEWQQDYEQLVQVAEMYVDAFGKDEMLTLLEAMRLTAVRDAIARWRKKQEM